WIMMGATKTVEKRTGKRLHDPEPKNSNGFQYFALNVDVKNGTIDLVGSFDAVRHSVDTSRKAKKKIATDGGNKERKDSGRTEAPDRPVERKRPIRGGGGRRLPPPPPPDRIR